MSKQQKGLGRGLDALLGGGGDKERPRAAEELAQLPASSLKPGKAFMNAASFWRWSPGRSSRISE